MATKITYTQQGDYLMPDLKLPEQPKVEIGIWGKRHLGYLKSHHHVIYTNLLTSCKFTAYEYSVVVEHLRRLKLNSVVGVN